jgi:hypothetical protein
LGAKKEHGNKKHGTRVIISGPKRSNASNMRGRLGATSTEYFARKELFSSEKFSNVLLSRAETKLRSPTAVVTRRLDSSMAISSEATVSRLVEFSIIFSFDCCKFLMVGFSRFWGKRVCDLCWLCVIDKLNTYYSSSHLPSSPL